MGSTHTQSRTMQAPRERGEHTHTHSHARCKHHVRGAKTHHTPLELTSTTIATSLLYEKALAKLEVGVDLQSRFRVGLTHTQLPVLERRAATNRGVSHLASPGPDNVR